MDASNALRLYRHLQAQGITLTIDGPDLVIEPFSLLSEDTIALIQAAKPFLLQFVRTPPETWIPAFAQTVRDGLTPDLAALVRPEWFRGEPVAVHLLSEPECAALSRSAWITGRTCEVQPTPAEDLPT